MPGGSSASAPAAPQAPVPRTPTVIPVVSSFFHSMQFVVEILGVHVNPPDLY